VDSLHENSLFLSKQRNRVRLNRDKVIEEGTARPESFLIVGLSANVRELHRGNLGSENLDPIN
jgi:hypothetical protein